MDRASVTISEASMLDESACRLIQWTTYVSACGIHPSSRKTFSFGSGLHKQVTISDFLIATQDGDTIPLRLYRPVGAQEESLPLLMFFHGGGYLFGTIQSEDARCSKVATDLGIAVLSVCYRHTPHFKYPTQHLDAWDAFQWCLQNLQILGADGGQVIVSGISSGGGLAASVVLKHHRQCGADTAVKGQILCIPSLIPPEIYPFDSFESEQVGSIWQNKGSPILPAKQRQLFHDLLDAQSHDETPYAMYGVQGVPLTGMPETSFLIAGMDALRDEAFLYAEQLRSAWYVDVHVFREHSAKVPLASLHKCTYFQACRMVSTGLRS